MNRIAPGKREVDDDGKKHGRTGSYTVQRKTRKLHSGWCSQHNHTVDELMVSPHNIIAAQKAEVHTHEYSFHERKGKGKREGGGLQDL